MDVWPNLLITPISVLPYSKRQYQIYYLLIAEDSRLEIDFVVQSDGKPLPIEVKAGGNVRANSLTRLLAEHPELKALRYSILPHKEQSQMTYIPLYAVR